MNYNGWKSVEVSVAVFASSKMASFNDLCADSDSAYDYESDSADDSVSDMEMSREEEEQPDIPEDERRRRRLQQWEEMFGSSDSEEEFSSFEADELELPRAAVRPQPVNFQRSYESAWLKDFTEAAGLRFDGDGMTEVDLFMKLFSGEETVVHLVNETNRYARQHIQKVGIENIKEHALANSWTDTNVAKMKAFLAIILVMGFTKLPAYQDYWSTDEVIQMPGI